MKKRKQQTVYIKKEKMESERIATFNGMTFGEYFMPMIVVYANTADFPGKVVARLFDLNKPTPYVVVADSMEVIRKRIPKRFANIGRNRNDDPVIREVWV